MSDTDTPYSDSMQQWDIACQHFQDDFGFDAHEIITINTIREMFSELVEEYKLSLNASISLMYGLYFFLISFTFCLFNLVFLFSESLYLARANG